VEIEGLSEALGVAGRIRWLGQLDHRRIPTFLAALDVALLPYPALPDFGFSPLKLFEYLAAGAPVVASDLGQVRDVLEQGRWGRLVAPGDPDALAAGIRAVLDDLRGSRAIAAAARRDALRRHSWDERARRLTELFATARPGALAA
jgi:glycosyltransferase involved in cell wall biosynthesis